MPLGGQVPSASGLGHAEVQREGAILTGIQAPKEGGQISEPWEGVGVELWLLFAQAVGGQPE